MPAVAIAQPAARGTITGRVTEQGSGRPLADAQVIVVGTQIGAQTGPDGTFRIAGVPAGPVVLRALRIGFRATTQSVTVPSGGSVVAALALASAPTSLEQVVVTATGGTQRQREQGNAVAQITPDTVALAAVPNVAGLVNGRAAGVSVVGVAGTTGTGARIRIRGANSLSLANDPLLIIDGVRINSDPNSYSPGTGGQSASRLNDLLPEDIEDVQILKGPAATGLYGTQAANGVIQITTRRGRQGAAQWNAYAEAGAVNDRNTYPANWGAYGLFADSTGALTVRSRGCDLATQAFGGCKQDSVINFNPMVVHSPFRTGPRLKGGANVSGGSERSTYYLSADYTSEDGVYQTNALRQASVRANVTARPTSTLDVATSAGFVRSQLQLPRNDNDYFGYVSNGVGGLAYDNAQQGYDPVGPNVIDRLQSGQDVNRFTGSVTATYRPLAWLSVIGVAGLDNVNRFDNQTYPPGVIPPGFFGLDVGYRESDRFTINTSTANLSAVATRQLSGAITSTTTAGFQYQRDDSRGTTGSALGLAAGTSSLSGGVSQFTVGEPFARNALVGGLAQEQVAVRDRLFVTAGLRADKNSAFGQNFGTVYYPSANASWVVSDEPFFPKPDALNSLRLRAAFGRSGLRPGVNDALRYYRPTAARVNGNEQSGITIGNLGDPNLRPERTSEFETGLDLTSFGSRANLELTYYNKRSSDALVLVPSPPSSGFPAQYRNLGAVSNRGLEALLTLVPIRTDPVAWTSTFNFSTNRNRLLKLGLPSPVIFAGGRQRHQVGYPLGGYWGPKITYADSNKNGVIEPNEVVIADSDSFLGNSLPTRTLGWTNDVTLLKWLRFSALVDYKGGFKQYNSTEDFRCQLARCQGINDPTSSLDRQAKSIASNVDGVATGWIESADFVKLRELSLTATLPTEFARRARARAMSVTVAGRNLHTWTNYSGIDPEVNSVGASNFAQSDFLSQPQVRYITVRVNLSY
ncbi:SusC/RagA family TonB-linked outer membrane protein [Gemmatimonadetes bacterium T265]|nr:SusC/RagA family TonB-linked outer membrane protein [Gemmatimonadetes bacterium T265]